MVASAVPEMISSKGEVIGKPANKNWKVKVGKLTDAESPGYKTRNISFSEDGGKTYFPIATGCNETTVVWSPNGKHLLFSCLAGPRFLPPYVQEGYLFFYPSLYDPAKRTIFSPNFGDALYFGARWEKGSKTGEISIKSFDNDYSRAKKLKVTASEWEKKSKSVDVSPYLAWFASKIGNVLVHKNDAEAGEIIKIINCNSARRKELLGIFRDAVTADYPVRAFVVHKGQRDDFTHLFFSYGYNRRSTSDPSPGAKYGCFVNIGFETSIETPSESIKIRTLDYECE